MNFANTILKAKQLKGMNQLEFASFLGKSQSQVSKYLNGKSVPPYDVYIRCMNITSVEQELNTNSNEVYAQLKEAIRFLRGKENIEFCQALLSIITAYRNQI
ncbi:helix-turn-helix transcriptional regulator [Microbulbifer sp. VAAF005]|uniref:helix-turn-helix domain-containing protein n=1 Tax=Microbulbifer sp. VAAF005 TaxID=3034230 RepID=UPI0024ADCB9B|nr:helix-turn-helix transcriptional regulator [Microbulbifer sp. VAAF005]WHI44626.1 helix-turn-helix transcriptional regulator [Microbulbifer sp. VAAF005]